MQDDYIHDGRVLVEKLRKQALPRSLRCHDEDGDNDFIELARVYKQLNAPLGSVGVNSLAFATQSIKGTATTYTRYLSKIADITADRDALASEIKNALAGAEFSGQPLKDHQADRLIRRAERLIDEVEDLAHRNDHRH